MSVVIIYGIFIICSIILLIGWYQLVKWVRTKTKMPTEKVFLLAMVLMLISALLIWRGAVIAGNWEHTYSPETKTKIKKFTLAVYKPLDVTRERVTTEIENMHLLLEDVNDLIDEHPRHANMLISIKTTWSNGLYQLKKLQKVIEKDIRRAWIAHDTRNEKIIDARFSRQAVILDNHLNEGLKEFRKLIIDVHKIIRKDISTARKKIGVIEHDLSAPSSLKLPNFSTDTSEKLLTFSRTISDSVHTGLSTVLDETNITEQRQEKVKLHLEHNHDLSQPLITVLDYWKAAERYNKYYLDQLFYALESVFLGRKLGLQKADYAVVAMAKTLKKKIPKFVKAMQDKRDMIDNSY